MQYTGNYKLKKPDGTDLVKISDLNANADIIDQKLRELDNHTNDKNNPHGTTPEQIGAETPEGVQAKVDVVQENLNLHINDKNNPHMVTPSQIGAETPTGAQNRVDAHAKRTDNPHKVTRTQLGLVNVVVLDTSETGLVFALEDPDNALMPEEATGSRPVDVVLPIGVRYIQLEWSGTLSTSSTDATAYAYLMIDGEVVATESFSGGQPVWTGTNFHDITDLIPCTPGRHTISVAGTDTEHASGSATVQGIVKIYVGVKIL